MMTETLTEMQTRDAARAEYWRAMLAKAKGVGDGD